MRTKINTHRYVSICIQAQRRRRGGTAKVEDTEVRGKEDGGRHSIIQEAFSVLEV